VAFQQVALSKLKAGQPLVGKEGVLTSLIKQILVASLEDELEAHLSDCQAKEQPNRMDNV
jgi:putative transposase